MLKRHLGKRPKNNPYLEPLGWYGMVAVLVAYGLSTFGILTAVSTPYLALNASGAAALAYHSYAHKDAQPVVLNVVWLAIAVVTALRVLTFDGAYPLG